MGPKNENIRLHLPRSADTEGQMPVLRAVYEIPRERGAFHPLLRLRKNPSGAQAGIDGDKELMLSIGSLFSGIKGRNGNENI